MLGFKIEADTTDSDVTRFAGLLPYMELWRRLKMPSVIDQTVHICGEQGWLDRQIVESLVLLNIAGGDCVTDIEKLESDAGLCRMYGRNQYSGMGRLAVKQAQARFRGGRRRTFPAPTQISAFLEGCHNEQEEPKRVVGKAFIPQANEHLLSLRQLNSYLVAQAQHLHPCRTATLDGDATLVEKEAGTALFCYKGFRGYQPYNIYWHEQDLVLHSEFRDGNVPAGYEIKRAFQESISMLPQDVACVMTRQDSAAYQNDFMAWCVDAKEHPRIGEILFTISADITPELREAITQTKDWQPMKPLGGNGGKSIVRECAEILFVSAAQANDRRIVQAFRYIAVRERMTDQLSLLEMDEQNLPFPIATMDNVRYKVQAIVSNRYEEDAQDLIQWHYRRCGKSEEAHSIMKSDFAGGQMPSAKFGANAAWWAIMILAMNFNAVMRHHVIGGDSGNKRMKAMRFELIASAARVIHHARQCFLRTDLRLQKLLFKISLRLQRMSVPAT
jgi:hypothetical protein